MNGQRNAHIARRRSLHAFAILSKFNVLTVSVFGERRTRKPRSARQVLNGGGPSPRRSVTCEAGFGHGPVSSSIRRIAGGRRFLGV